MPGHLEKSPVSRDDRLDERRRLRNSGLLALISGSIQHLVAAALGSEALHADAWHQVTDSLPSFFNWLIVTLALTHPEWEKRYRIGGGYGQAIFMLLAAAAILFHMEGIGAAVTRNYFAVVIVSVVATAIGWRRYRILHAGSPLAVFRLIVDSIRHGTKLNVTYLTEVVHAFLDVFFSAVAGLAGVAGILGWSQADEVVAYAMAGLLVLGGLITAFFSRHQHHDCSHH